MFSFETYKKHYLQQFFLDLGIVALLAAVILYFRFKQQVPLDEFYLFSLKLLLVFSLLRIGMLMVWLGKSMLQRNWWMSLFSGVHIIVFGAAIWGILFLALLLAGLIGITLDGTEHQN